MTDISKFDSEFDKAVKLKLYQKLGEAAYKSWIHYTGFKAKGLDWDGEPEFLINTGFAEYYIKEHYGIEIKRAFDEVFSLLRRN